MAGGRAESLKPGFQSLNPREVGELLNEVSRRELVVSLKFPNSGVFKAQVRRRGWGQSMELDRPAGLGLSRQDEEATGHLKVGDEVYFFTATVLIEGAKLVLRLHGEVFRLARRRSRRWSVPQDLEIRYTIRRADDRLLFLTFAVSDLSLHGARLLLPKKNPSLRPGSRLDGVLRVGARAPIAILAEVRHARSGRSGEMILGVQWTEVGDLGRLAKLILELQSRAFQRAIKR